MQSVRNYLRIINDDYAIIDTNWYRDISTEVEENKVQSNSQRNFFYSRCNNANIKPREVSFLTTKGVIKTNTSAGASSSNVDEIGKVHYKLANKCHVLYFISMIV